MKSDKATIKSIVNFCSTAKVIPIKPIRCLGDDIIWWLIHWFHTHGIQTADEPKQDDGCYYLTFHVSGLKYYFYVGLQDDQPNTGSKWVGWLERRNGFFDLDFTGIIFPEAVQAIDNALKASPDIQQVTWREKLDLKNLDLNKLELSKPLIVIITLHIIAICSIYSFDLIRAKKVEDSRPDLAAKAAELQSISASLKQLSDYVTSQEASLQTTAKALYQLKNEKTQMEHALSIDKAQLRSLAIALDTQSSVSKWLDRILSFLLGTLSSILAAFLWERLSRQSTKGQGIFR